MRCSRCSAALGNSSQWPLWTGDICNARAAWGDQPVEALTQRQLPQRTSGRATVAHDRQHAQGGLNRADVGDRIQRQQALFIQFNQGFQVVLRLAHQDDASVDEFATVHTRQHADDGVVIGMHAAPPRLDA